MRIIKSQEMPAPNDLVQYPDGELVAVMFHYSAEESSCEEIAETFNFDCSYRKMEDEMPDDNPIMVDYLQGGNIWQRQWNPQPPLGWQFGARMDTEDGPIAVFIRSHRID